MRSIANAALLGILALLLSATLTTQDAQAATQEDFEATCFDSAGEFLPTDGCWSAYEGMGYEIDNLIESIEKSCTLSDMYEDYSCKGPSAPSSSSSTEQGTVAEQGCVTVDMKSEEVSGQDIDVLTQQYGFDVEAGNPDELLYSPACFEQGLVQWDESMLENPCYDVVGATLETAVPEYIGCPAASLSEQATTPLSTQVSQQATSAWPTPQDTDQAQNLSESIAKGCAPENLLEDLSCKGPQYKGYTPITQQGTPARADWRSHVTPVKPAKKVAQVSTANPLIAGDTGRDVAAYNKRYEDSPAKFAARQAENKAKAAKIMAQEKKSKKKK